MLFWKNCIYLWQLSSNATFVSIWLCWTHIHTFHGRFPVWSSLYRYYSIATCKNKPVVSRAHSQGICQNRFLYLLERSSEAPVTLFWAKSSIKSEEISASGMPCPGGMSVGITSSFCRLYWSYSQVLHAFVVMVVMSWYNPSQLRCWLLAWFSLFLLVACGGWPKYISAASQEW